MKIAQRLALTTCLATLVLIAIGAMVRATGSGLGCPDWPTCHGGVVPPGEKESLIEFSHRFLGSVVGLLVIATAVSAWRYYRRVPFAVWVATASVPLVGLQGLLGAVTVWRELPPEIVATHLITAMIVLSFELAVLVSMYLQDPSHADQLRSIASAPTRQIGHAAIACLAWLAAVMWIGGYMAESGASTACTGWPLCNGSVFPSADGQEVTHMVHRYLAGAFVLVIVPLVAMGWRERRRIFWTGPVAMATAVLYIAQVVVGALNIWFTFPDTLTISHTVIAALLWFTLAGAALLTYYVPAKVHETRPLTHTAGASS